MIKIDNFINKVPIPAGGEPDKGENGVRQIQQRAFTTKAVSIITGAKLRAIDYWDKLRQLEQAVSNIARAAVKHPAGCSVKTV